MRFRRGDRERPEPGQDRADLPDTRELEPLAEPDGVAALGAAQADQQRDDVAVQAGAAAASVDLPPGVQSPRPNRTIWVMVAIAVASLAAGVALSQLVISPAQRAAEAEPPAAGLITVPVEERMLSTDVTVRGDAGYDSPVQVRLDTAEIGGAAIVTGQVPEVGASVEGGQVLLEVTGRPVVVLPGDLPAYRTLRVGSSGPDVAQLKAALIALGIDPGNADSDVYDATTAAGVDALYAMAGYPSPTPSEDAQAALESARDGVRAAEAEVASAQAALDTAAAGPSRVERLQNEAAVDEARAALAAARNDGDAAQIRAAERGVEIAIATRDAALNPDVRFERAARDSAASALSDAQAVLTEARNGTLTHLPSSEVVYVASLPRRVDAVDTQRGAVVEGAIVTISGADLQIRATLSRADADLLAVDMPAVLTVGDTEVPAVITAIGGASGGTGGGGSEEDDGEGQGGGAGSDGRIEATLVPIDLTPEQAAELAGQNVRVSIPVSATDGQVLAVPVAALTAGPGGESRVEVAVADGTTQLVVVETGLSAQGYVEIISSETSLEPGDRVVVGR